MSYEKQNFVNDQTLTADHLNHIEDGIEAIDNNINKSHWKNKIGLTYGDSITAINNPDCSNGGYVNGEQFNSWGSYIIDELGLSKLYGRGIGGQTYSWRNKGGSVAFINSDGSLHSRIDESNYDDYNGEIPEGTTKIRGSMSSWLRITTQIPENIKDELDFIFIMAGTNDIVSNVNMGNANFINRNSITRDQSINKFNIDVMMEQTMADPRQGTVNYTHNENYFSVTMEVEPNTKYKYAWLNTELDAYLPISGGFFIFLNYEMEFLSYITEDSDGIIETPDNCYYVIHSIYSSITKEEMSSRKPMFVEDSLFNNFNDMFGNYIPYNNQEVTMIENVDIEWFESDYYNGGDFDLTTYIGSLCSTIMKVQAWCPNAIIIIGTPLSGRSSDGSQGNNQTSFYKNSLDLSYLDYVEETIKTARLYSIPCIDVYGNSGINPFNRNKFISDMVHPYTNLGTKALARVVISGLLGIYPNLN